VEKTDVGIVGLGWYLPEKAVAAEELAAKEGMEAERCRRLGYGRITLAEEGQLPSEMAVLASRRALRDAGLGPEAVDVIIYCGAFKDHSRWQASNKVQAELEAFNSYVFDLDQNAAGQAAALRLAEDLIRHEPEVNTVLICGAECFGTSLEGRRLGNSFLMGDGASAAVVRAGARGLRLRASASAACGRWHRRVCMLELGAAYHFDEQLLERKGHLLQVVREPGDEQLREQARQELKRIAQQVVLEGLELADRHRSDIALLLHTALPRPHAQDLSEALGFSSKQTTMDYLADTGVLGGPELFYYLERARKECRFSAGQWLILLGVGAGLVASAALLEA